MYNSSLALIVKPFALSASEWKHLVNAYTSTCAIQSRACLSETETSLQFFVTRMFNLIIHTLS